MKKLTFHCSGRTVILAWILAAFGSLYLEMMREAKVYYLTGVFTGILNSDYSSSPIFRMAVQAICIFLALYFILGSKKVLAWIDRYRFAIAVVILGISLLFRLSGSSLAEWPIFFGNKYGNCSGPLFR